MISMEVRRDAQSPREETPAPQAAPRVEREIDLRVTSEPQTAPAFDIPLEPSSQLKLIAGEERAKEQVRDAVGEIIRKLFEDRGRDGGRQLYVAELAEAAKSLEIDPQELLQRARRELAELAPAVGADGKIADCAGAPHLAALLGIVQQHVDYYLICGSTQLDSAELPLSASARERLQKIVEQGECVMLLLTKNPPAEAVEEIRQITEQQLGGLASLWADPAVRAKLAISPGLADYLAHATVRVLCTGENQEANRLAREINVSLERNGGFEDLHWLRVVKGIWEHEKSESLKQALQVCAPVLVTVKLLEHYASGWMHAVGGVVDDFFGAILPDATQNMGDNSRPLGERLRKAWGVMKGGLITLPLAAALGKASAVIYEASPSPWVGAVAGVAFALACCGGTIGTSIAAYLRARRAADGLSEQGPAAEVIGGMSRWQKMKLAFREAILDVPFRIGHTLIGVPFQIGLGIAAGTAGFFNSSWFVSTEGMAETVLGAATAWCYPIIMRALHERRLRKIDVRS